MSKLVIYIAGPMSGLPEYNHRAFDAEEERLKKTYRKADIINPAMNDIGSTAGLSEQEIWRRYMKISVNQVMRSNLVVMLPNWNRSKGARLEHRIAEDFQIPIAYR